MTQQPTVYQQIFWEPSEWLSKQQFISKYFGNLLNDSASNSLSANILGTFWMTQQPTVYQQIFWEPSEWLSKQHFIIKYFGNLLNDSASNILSSNIWEPSEWLSKQHFIIKYFGNLLNDSASNISSSNILGTFWMTQQATDYHQIPTDKKASSSNLNFNILKHKLALALLTWRIWWAPNNTSRWQIGFHLAFEGLNSK